MTHTIFVSGSRSIRTLDPATRHRILGIVAKQFDIVIGDADGVDRAVQVLLAESGYQRVSVYVPGDGCRNNIGDWPVRNISVPYGVYGRSFYTVRDKAMAVAADYGFVIWDGRSKGSLDNIRELYSQRKKSLIYLHDRACFRVIAQHADLYHLSS